MAFGEGFCGEFCVEFCVEFIEETAMTPEEFLKVKSAADWKSAEGFLCISVWTFTRDSIWRYVIDTASYSVTISIYDSVGDFVWSSVHDSVRESVWDSVGRQP